MRSKHADNPTTDLIKKISSVLRERGMIEASLMIPLEDNYLTFLLEDYIDSFPIRTHGKNWVAGGDQIAAFHPETNTPFFFNISGSMICKLCDGEHNIRDLISELRKEWPSEREDVLIRDLIRFLLLLEEIDLIEFRG